MKKLSVLAFAALVTAGCGGSSGDTQDRLGLHAHNAGNPLPARAAAVVVDTCVLDTWQLETLHDAATAHVLSEVVLLCLVPGANGTVAPSDPSAAAQIASTIADLHKVGYRVNLGVAFTDESGQRFDGAQTAMWISDPLWRAQFETSLVPAIADADGVEIDMEKLPGSAAQSVTALATEVSALVRPAKRLNLWVPPSITIPSDLPDGDSFPIRTLGPLADRLRVMTLDYSEGGPPGPTIDPGWAVDAMNLARTQSPNVDIAYPLYGIDFGPNGLRLSSWTEAMGIASSLQIPIQRSPTNTPNFGYVSQNNEPHQIWWDDAESTADALGAWTYDVVPEDVGVLFWGLGSEDPELFQALRARLP